MEEWLHFTETYSAYVFQPGVLPPLLQEMWDITVEVVEKYCRPGEGKGSPDSAREGAELCARLGKLMEENSFPSSMFTYNLHLVACR
jgi:hypothetical protein